MPAGGSNEVAANVAPPQIDISYEQAGPTATTEPATEVTYNSATLNGTADTHGFASEGCFFEYGETTSYGQTAGCEPAQVESGAAVPTSARIHGLSAKTRYRYRLVLTAEGHTVYGEDQAFETEPAPPTVSGVSPLAGFEEGGNTVHITGTGFNEATEVRFGTASASFTVDSDSSITATAPEHREGPVIVTVTNPGGTSPATVKQEYVYVRHGHSPTITVLSTKKSPAIGGVKVNIFGTSFVGVTAVKFGEESASYKVINATEITATAPPGPSGTTEVTVYTPNGESGLTAKDRFTYGPPTITEVTPDQEPISAEGQVTVTGSGFNPASAYTSIMFGKGRGTNVQCASTTECIVFAPAAEAAGTVDVRAISGTKKSALTPADRFSYEAPTITGLSETSGPEAGGVELTVHGAGFSQGISRTIFTFGHTRAIRVECLSSTECTLLTPAATKPGTIDVTATVVKTTSTTGSADQYTYG